MTHDAVPHRAVVTVKDNQAAFHIRLETQGDPGRVAALCRAAIDLAPPLPAFAAGDWTVAIVAAAERHRAGGNDGQAAISLCPDWRGQGELDYRYELGCDAGRLQVKAWQRDAAAAAYRLDLVFTGDLCGFIAFAGLPRLLPGPLRHLALFQGPDTDLFILAFDDTPDAVEELAERLERALRLGLLAVGQVIRPDAPIHGLGAENIHLALDQLFQDFPPRKAGGGPPPSPTLPSAPTDARTAP